MSVGGTLEDGDAACARGDLTEAMRIWNAFVAENPTSPEGYLRIGAALRAAQRFGEADQTYDRGLRQCEDRLALLINRAWVAHEQQHWPEALNRWSDLAKTHPSHGSGHIGMNRVLLRLNREREADAILSAYLSRWPGVPEVLFVYAQTATARERWSEALARWDAYLTLRPDDQRAIAARGNVLWQVQLEDETPGAADRDDAVTDRAPVQVGKVKDPDARHLLMTFESLGENCEFGLVQRRFEAEPIGLLRWTYTAPGKLAQLLETRFAGLGEPENIVLARSDWGEYYFSDRKFGIHFHTFLTQTLEDEATFLKKQIARMRWMRERMLEDLASCEKIFVFKAHHHEYEDLIERIGVGLRRYGPNTLLWVSRAPEPRLVGSAIAAGTGVVRGYLSAMNPVQKRWDIPFEEWLSICRQARVLVGAGS